MAILGDTLQGGQSAPSQKPEEDEGWVQTGEACTVSQQCWGSVAP